MKKLFFILILFPLFSTGQQRDTFLFYRGDTLIRHVRVTTSVDEPLIIDPEENRLREYYALNVYEKGIYEYDAIDSFQPKPWPAGLFKGTRYYRHFSYKSYSKDGKAPFIIQKSSTITNVEHVSNFFFTMSLAGGLIMLIILYFSMRSEYRDQKEISSWKYVSNFLMALAMLTVGIGMGFLSAFIPLGVKYFPQNELITVSVMGVIAIFLLFKVLRKQYPMNN